MNVTLALNAINGILAACDDETRQRVMKQLYKPENKKRKREPLVTKQQAREDVLKYFERRWKRNREKIR